MVKKWKVHWYVWLTDGNGNEDRHHRSRVIGTLPGQKDVGPQHQPVMTRAEAQAELDRILVQESGQGKQGKPNSRMLFGSYWRTRWLPLRLPTWSRNTRVTNLPVLNGHISYWDKYGLHEIDAPKVAAWIAPLAETASPSLVRKVHTYMRSILEEATDEGYLDRNPLRRWKRPKVKRRTDTTVLTPKQLQAVRNALKGTRDVLLFDLLMATALRPGELMAVRWDDVQEGGLRVDENFTRGAMEKPKTPSSYATVALPEELLHRMELWRLESKPASGRDLVFPNQAGHPMHSENWRKRQLATAAKEAKVGKVTYQMIRRTVATLAIGGGVPLKAVQAQLRHASARTTMDVYAQVVTQEQAAAAEQIFDLMRGRKPSHKQATEE